MRTRSRRKERGYKKWKFIVGAIAIAVVVVAIARSNKPGSAPVSQTAATTTASVPATSASIIPKGDTLLVELNRNPKEYNGKTVSVHGMIIGIEPTPGSAPSSHDYRAYLVDGETGISLTISDNPAFRQVVSGDVVRVDGTFAYRPFNPFGGTNNLDDSTLEIGSKGTVSITVRSDSVVPTGDVFGSTKSLLAAESGNITRAADQPSGSWASCVSEYTKIWNKMCSYGNMPDQCDAVNFLSSVKLVNDATAGLLTACYRQNFRLSPGVTAGKIVGATLPVSDTIGLPASLLLTPGR